MSKTFAERIPDLTIPLGEQYSEEMTADTGAYGYSDAVAIAIASPVGLAETVVWQTSFDGGATWVPLEETDGSDMTMPAAGKARAYFSLPMFPMLRLAAGIAVAADRVFKLNKLWQV